MDKDLGKGRKAVGIASLIIVAAILVFSFIMESYSPEDADSIHQPIEIHFGSAKNLTFLAVALIGIGVLSWLIVSKVMLKGVGKKKEISSSKTGFKLK